MRAERPPLVNIKPSLFSRLIRLNYGSSNERWRFFRRQSRSHLPPVGARVLLKSLFNDLQPSPVRLAHFVPILLPRFQDQRGQLRFKSQERSISVFISTAQSLQNAVYELLQTPRMPGLDVPGNFPLTCFASLLLLSSLDFASDVQSIGLLSVRQPLSQNTPAHWKSFESNSHKPNRLFSPSIPLWDSRFPF